MSKRRLLVIIPILVIVILLLIGFLSFRNRAARTEEVLGLPADGLGTMQRVRLALQASGMLDRFNAPVNPEMERFLLEVEPGEGVASVLSKIAEGLSFDPEAMRIYWIYTGADRLINPGRYALSGTLTIPQITDLVTAAGNSLEIGRAHV